jgi:energy-coupling factor transporter transmembrane protein EcfT
MVICGTIYGIWDYKRFNKTIWSNSSTFEAIVYVLKIIGLFIVNGTIEGLVLLIFNIWLGCPFAIIVKLLCPLWMVILSILLNFSNCVFTTKHDQLSNFVIGIIIGFVVGMLQALALL